MTTDLPSDSAASSSTENPVVSKPAEPVPAAEHIPVRILGIDPGLANTGWGVIETLRGRQRALAYGCIVTDPKTDRIQRLRQIHDDIAAVIDRYAPTEMAVEAVYFGTNAKGALSLGEVRGAAMLAAAMRNLSFDEYSVTQIKQNTVGKGRADKNQIQFMVKALLGLTHQPQPDHSADALAVALCHAQLRRLR